MAPSTTLPTLSQVSTYLLGVCLFSISFLVFLNSSVSFVITDIIGQKYYIGDAVGSLGFADELVAIIACPMWGMLSDRVGVRLVAVVGYVLVGLALVVFVQAHNVYPQLLLARMFFALGGAACTTMVTAILPSVVSGKSTSSWKSSHLPPSVEPSTNSPIPSNDEWPSEGVFYPKSLQSWYRISSSRLAGLVGLCTGCGALIALTLFLPLPTYLQKSSQTPAEALRNTYYIVGCIAFVISLICLFGLRHLQGQEDKGIQNLILRLSSKTSSSPIQKNLLPYWSLLTSSLRAGLHPDIGLGYIGGFVARASSVGISLFIPLLINNYFLVSGRCKIDDSTQIKRDCHEAYILAAKLTGISQLVALILAPAYGYFSERKRALHIPLLVAALAGITGYTALCSLVNNPDPATQGGGKLIYLWVSLIGASQIGAIVCSLGCISNGIATSSDSDSVSSSSANTILPPPQQTPSPSTAIATNSDHTQSYSHENDVENEPLLPSSSPQSPSRRDPYNPQNLQHLQGSIAGTYSLAGGVAILLLTKVGGMLFDSVSPAAPFAIMAVFNGLLLLGVAGRAARGVGY